jgi:acyl-CoA dehydrogenase
METGFEIIDDRFGDVFANLPGRFAAWLLRVVVQPGGPRRRGPDDAITVDCAELLLSPSPARERLTPGLCLGYGDDAVARLERAFKLVHDTEPIRKKVRAAGVRDWREARRKKAIDAAEARRMEETDAAVQKVIEVDDFAPEELGPRIAVPRADAPKSARAQPRRAAAKRG